MSVYYAHSMKKYHTLAEKQEFRLLQDTFPDDILYNPNNEDVRTAPSPMDYCLERVKSCDALAFSTISGYIGKGVWREIETAKREGLDVWMIQNKKIVAFTGTLQIINQNWHTKFAKVR